MYDGYLGGLVRRYGWQKFQIASRALTASGILLQTLLFVLHGFASTFLGVSIAYLGAGLLCVGLPLIIITPNRRQRYTVFETAFADPTEAAPLVEGQPVPEIAALELPTSIDWETRKPVARFAAIMAWLLFVDMFVITRNAFALLPLALITLGIIVSIVRDQDVALGADGQRVCVDAFEMVVRPDSTKREAIAWNDVRVFALIQQPPNGARVYLLSSGDAEVR